MTTHQETSSLQTAGLKALIIEDRREIIVFLANNILKPKGFEIITARDGKTGLRRVLEENPDLIITDLNLPQMPGLDIMADLQDRGSTIPIIVITLHGSEQTAIQAFRLGAKDYLLKPLRVNEVEKALERALDPRAKSSPPPDNMASLQSLEQKISDLKTTIAQQQKQLIAYEAKQPPEEGLERKLIAQEKEMQHHINENTHLNDLLEQQKQLTTETRNRAKAMLQFIVAQHKEMIRQKKEADKLVKQITTLSGSMSKLASRLDKQVHQFEMVSSTTGSGKTEAEEDKDS